MEKVRRYVDAAGVLFMELDLEGKVRLLNPAGAELLGYAETELLGKSFIDTLIPPEDRESVQGLFARRVEGKRPERGAIEQAVLNRKGERRLLRFVTASLQDGDGGRIGFVTTAVDVTEARRHDQALDDYRYALDQSAIVAITDAKGVISHVNDEFCRVSKYSRSELMGRTHQVINSGHHSKAFFRDLWSTIESGRIWRGDIKNKAKDGSYYWVATTIVPFLDASGKPVQYLAIRFEITDRKQAEEALERTVRELAAMTDKERERAEELEAANRKIVEDQAKLISAEKLSSVGMLAAGVAHEINNPLAGVMACVKALRDGSVGPDRRAEYFEAIRDGLERMRGTVQGLLDYARPQSTGFGAVDAVEMVNACLLLLTPQLRRKQLTLVRELDGAKKIQGDRSQLLQAVMNVLLNAIHAAPAGSRITLGAKTSGADVLLTFRDEGPGIPKEHLSRVTDPFFTTKPPGEGTGLGLAVTLSILKAHRGELRFDTEPGKGTLVTFRLPATE